MATSFSYQDYLSAFNSNYAEDDAGNRQKPLTEQEWANLDPAEQYKQSQIVGAFTDKLLDADEETAAAFREKFGDTPGDWSLELNDEKQSGLAIGYGDPKYGDADWARIARDPSRIMWLDPEGTENRRYVIERENMNPDEVIGAQSRDHDTGLSDKGWAALVLAAFGGAYALGEGGFLGAEAASSATPSTVSGVVSGTEGFVPGVTDAAATTSTAASTGANTLANYSGMTGGLDGGGLVASQTAGGGTGGLAGAGVSAGAGTGGGSSFMPQWFTNLSPSAQRVVLSAAGQGASAAISSINQSRANDAAAERQQAAIDARRGEEDRARAERERNRQVARRNVTFTPRTSGLIAGQRGGT